MSIQLQRCSYSIVEAREIGNLRLKNFKAAAGKSLYLQQADLAQN